MRKLLGSGQAREDGRVTVDGREAVRNISPTSLASMLVDAETYVPIEWTDVGDDGTRRTRRFETYERPATPANLALLSLTAQHPDATVVHDVTIEGVN